METELAYFNEQRPYLLEHHEGKYALIVERELLGTFDTRQTAFRVGLQLKGRIPMLIKQVNRRDYPLWL